MTAPGFVLPPYSPYGAVGTFPVWSGALASSFATACDGQLVPLDVEPAEGNGDYPPQLLWSPSTRRVHLVGSCWLTDVDPTPGGVLVGTDPIDVLTLPDGYQPPVNRTGAAATDDGWVRWLISGGSKTLQILTLGDNFPPVRLGGVLRLPAMRLDGITWRVPRTP